MSNVKASDLNILGVIDTDKLQGTIAALYNETFKNQLKEQFKQGTWAYNKIQSTISELLGEEARSLVKQFLQENKGFQALITQTIEKAVEAKAKQSMDKLIANTAGSAYNGAKILTEPERVLILGMMATKASFTEDELKLKKKLQE